MPLSSISGITYNGGVKFNTKPFNDGTNSITNINGYNLAVLEEAMNINQQYFVWAFTNQDVMITANNQWTPTGVDFDFTEDLAYDTNLDGVLEAINDEGHYNLPSEPVVTGDAFVDGLNQIVFDNWLVQTGWVGPWLAGQDALRIGTSWRGHSEDSAYANDGNDVVPTNTKGHNLTQGDNYQNVSSNTNSDQPTTRTSPFFEGTGGTGQLEIPFVFNDAADSRRHLYREASISGVGATGTFNNFHLNRTPARQFVHADDTSKKYFGFYYHAASDHHANGGGAEIIRMGNNMKHIYYPPLDFPNTETPFVMGIYASKNSQANFGDDGLVFIGGVTVDDSQNYFTGTNMQDLPFRAKLLEVPDSSEAPSLWDDNPNKRIYFYIVTPPHESDYAADICITNIACNEYVNSPDWLEQFRRDTDDVYDAHVTPTSVGV